VSKDHFIDRNYWEDVTFVRGADSSIVELDYDRFQGKRVYGTAP
jgi:hypothetical protein